MNFRARQFLLEHIQHTMAFYHPRCVDRAGGFYHYFKDDGRVYDAHHRHLVSSARFVFNYAMAARQFGRSDYQALARHGLAFLKERHYNPSTGGYAWTLRDGQPEDTTNHCYGLAFVMVANATALRAGIKEARNDLYQTFELMEEHLWSPQEGLYKDEASADWREIAPYRGQNANMHGCEAMLAAFEATRDERFLERAYTLARHITVRQADLADGLIWEHYHPDWSIDWNYNRDDPKHLFRPWGFQIGHQTEWTKLLLTLARYQDESWMLERAQSLFDRALDWGWDQEHGGIVYGCAPDGSVCDGDKYFWVQAETFAAAARLADKTGDDRYWQWYDRIWLYAWRHFIDHEHGAWFRILDRQNHKYDDCKSPAGKTDYHTMGATYEVLSLL